MRLKRFVYVHNSSRGDGTYHRLPLRMFLLFLIVMVLVGVAGLVYLNGSKKPVSISRMRLKELEKQNLTLNNILEDLQGENDSVKQVVEKLMLTELELQKLMPPVDNSDSMDMNGNYKTLSLTLIQTYSDTLVAFLRSVAQQSGKPNLIWENLPVVPPVSDSSAVVSRPFGMGIDPFTGIEKMNVGTSYSALSGVPVRATANGVVTKSYRHNFLGNRVEVSHGNGIVTVYSHLMGLDIPVKRRVKKGDVIGRVGESGWSVGPQVHYQVLKNDVPVDPQQLIITELK